VLVAAESRSKSSSSRPWTKVDTTLYWDTCPLNHWPCTEVAKSISASMDGEVSDEVPLVVLVLVLVVLVLVCRKMAVAAKHPAEKQ
jgi:hypothetical protein